MAQLVDQFGKPLVVRPTPAPPMRASIEAGRADNEGLRSWADADSLGPNAALDPATLQRLRNRGRYESVNNSYCRGLVRAHANDMIGCVPRLQLSIPGDDGTAAKIIERKYGQWAMAAQIGLKYRLMEKAVTREGNAFALFDTDPDLRCAVKLDIRLVEDEQCATPPMRTTATIVNGIELNERGKPVRYWFLRNHPGENTYFAGAKDYFAVPANRVLHWFERDRIGQVRGMPRIVAGLPTFGKTRRFSEATITAAEFAACIAGLLKTTIPPADGVPVTVEAMDTIEVVKQMLLTLPYGQEAQQMKAEHPTTTYAEFLREKLNEAGRGSGAPLNVVSGNSSGYNYSSARMDGLPWQRGCNIERYDFRNVVEDPVFLEWYAEGRMISGYLPEILSEPEEWTWSWHYDGFDSIDQNKDATADDTRLRNGTTTYAEIFSAYGQDWQEEFEQMARERDAAKKLGLPWPLLFADPAVPMATVQEDDPNAPLVDPLPGAIDDDMDPDDTDLEPGKRPAYAGGRR